MASYGPLYPDLYYKSSKTVTTSDSVCKGSKIIKCWNCGNSKQQNRCVRVPYRKTVANEFVFQGYFCSVACAKRHIIDNWSHQSISKIMWLNEASTEYFGYKNPETIPPAPPRESLQDLGGCLTRREYNKRIKEQSATWSVQYPLITYPMKILLERECLDRASETLAGDDLFQSYVLEKEIEAMNDATTTIPPKKQNPKHKRQQIVMGSRCQEQAEDTLSNKNRNNKKKKKNSNCAIAIDAANATDHVTDVPVTLPNAVAATTVAATTNNADAVVVATRTCTGTCTGSNHTKQNRKKQCEKHSNKKRKRGSSTTKENKKGTSTKTTIKKQKIDKKQNKCKQALKKNKNNTCNTLLNYIVVSNS